ncbi:MAG: hypothetical protein ACR2FV_06085 [Ornithinimicrobium sp.]|uniref:hypothetical protein n=1 Tax=Ornithinimicrobium sp. TaxID=1977084 RepID=UPI0018134AD2|nr:hypothetical protein [Actinomycetota bacterium]
MAALALSPGPVLDDLPDGLTRICRERGLPLLTVPSPTPFLKIARAYWGLLARSGQERLTASLGAAVCRGRRPCGLATGAGAAGAAGGHGDRPPAGRRAALLGDLPAGGR